MKRILSLRPSPAMVVACTALFVALGGVSYGVATGFIDSREIRNNTIRTQDLRNNDIRAVDIRNSTIRGRDVALNTLTGLDIAESKLGKVPSAASADKAATAADASTLGGIGPSGFLRPDGSPFVALSPADGWGAGGTAPGYYVDPIGFVHLHGALQRGTGSGNGALALTLPEAARPGAAKRLPAYAETALDAVKVAGVRIEPSGQLFVNGIATGNLVSLEGITFRAGD